MRVAVLDVGSNTLRLLVADVGNHGVRAVRQAKTPLSLGDDIERLGYVTDRKVRALAKAARDHGRLARKLGCERLDVLVASPGRQAANAADVLAVLERTSGAAVRVLGAEEEAILAYDGALAELIELPASVAVCDVGGGSTQLVVGGARSGPAWVRSVDLGSLRLTRRMLGGDPPGRAAMDAARVEAARSFATLIPPLPRAAYAVGGTARNLSRLVGTMLGPEELTEAIELLTELPLERVVQRFGVSPQRARTLPAGALILAEMQPRLGVELEVGRGGLREGAALTVAREAAAA